MLSMKNGLRGAGLAAVWACAAAAAAADEAVVVTAARSPQRVSDVVAEVTVLDREAIARAEGRTLSELLSQQAGLQFTANGGLGKVSGLFIRGLEARHTLLLVDGVPVGSATVGTPSLDNLPLSAIERIEIVRGPMSSLYGSGAMGGVIQVFLRRGAAGLRADAKAVLGSDRHGQLAAGLSWGDGAFDAAAHVQHTQTRGFSATNAGVPFGSFNADRDGFRQNAGSLRLGWQAAADWRVEALALRSQATNDFDDGPGAASRSGLLNRLWSLSAKGRISNAWSMRASVSESLDAFDTQVSASAFAALGVIGTRQRLLAWENQVGTPVGTLLLMAERLEQQVSRPGAPFEKSRRSIDGLAAGLSGSAGAHTWQASARHDRNPQFGSDHNAALGYAFALAPAWRLGASLGTSFVAPSFNQLYFPGFGNALLLPEEGRHHEAFLRWGGARHSLRIAAYRHRYRGFITSGPQPINLPLAEVDGVTMSAEHRWRDVELLASLDHTDPRNATAGNANQGKLLPRRAQDALRLAADWKPGAWSLGATLVAFSHRFDNAANTTRLGGYGTLDVRADWALSRDTTLGVKINNLGDKTYQTALGYNQPARELFATLRWSLR